MHFPFRSAFDLVIRACLLLRRLFLWSHACETNAPMPQAMMTKHLHDFHSRTISISKELVLVNMGGRKTKSFPSFMSLTSDLSTKRLIMSNKMIRYSPGNFKAFMTSSKLLKIRWIRLTDSFVRMAVVPASR